MLATVPVKGDVPMCVLYGKIAKHARVHRVVRCSRARLRRPVKCNVLIFSHSLYRDKHSHLAPPRWVRSHISAARLVGVTFGCFCGFSRLLCPLCCEKIYGKMTLSRSFQVTFVPLRFDLVVLISNSNLHSSCKSATSEINFP